MSEAGSPLPGALPLELAAAKSRGGHAETGAGGVGLSAAVMRLTQTWQPPMAHLRSVNAHVCEAMGSQKAALWCAPREAAAGSAGDHVACISAFAFQGTNAHAVLRCTSLRAYTPGDFSSHSVLLNPLPALVCCSGNLV